jgi:short-subunit dehydrogenase
MEAGGGVIVGATGRLGAELAQRFSRCGVRLVLAGRDPIRLRALAADIDELTWPVACDLTDPVAVGRLADEATARLGDVDLLVYAAGSDTVAAAVEQSDATVDEQLAVNLTTPVQLTRRLLPGMLARRRGHLVYVGSLVGLAGGAYQAPYAAAKGGLDAWVRALRAEHRNCGVSFSIVHPAPIRGVGPYPARRGQYGRPPFVVGETDAYAVADAVMDAVARDRPQRLIGSPMMRAYLALQALAPALAERLVDAVGVPEYFRRIANSA